MGSRWVVVDSAQTSVVRVDTATISKTQRGTYLAWMETRYAQVQHAGDTAYTRTMVREEFDCGLRRLRMIEMHVYFAEEPSPVHHEAPRPGQEAATEWISAVPGTTGEAMVAGVAPETQAEIRLSALHA